MTAPAGSAAVTAATSARMAVAVPASRNRYCICAAGVVPGACSLAISPGSTQPPAELSTESAMPTMVSVTLPAAPGMVSCVPSGTETPLPGAGVAGQHQLPGPVRPVAGLQGQVVDRAARRGPPGHEHRPQGHVGAARPGLTWD